MVRINKNGLKCKKNKFNRNGRHCIIDNLVVSAQLLGYACQYETDDAVLETVSLFAQTVLWSSCCSHNLLTTEFACVLPHPAYSLAVLELTL